MKRVGLILIASLLWGNCSVLLAADAALKAKREQDAKKGEVVFELINFLAPAQDGKHEELTISRYLEAQTLPTLERMYRLAPVLIGKPENCGLEYAKLLARAQTLPDYHFSLFMDAIAGLLVNKNLQQRSAIITKQLTIREHIHEILKYVMPKNQEPKQQANLRDILLAKPARELAMMKKLAPIVIGGAEAGSLYEIFDQLQAVVNRLQSLPEGASDAFVDNMKDTKGTSYDDRQAIINNILSEMFARKEVVANLVNATLPDLDKADKKARIVEEFYCQTDYTKKMLERMLFFAPVIVGGRAELDKNAGVFRYTHVLCKVVQMNPSERDEELKKTLETELKNKNCEQRMDFINANFKING